MKKIAVSIAFLVLAFTVYSQDIPKLKVTEVEKMMNQKDSGILILNFWATFCKPCVAEIPSFIKIVDKYKNEQIKLMLISVDLPSYYPGKIAAFVKKNKFNTNVAWLDETNADYFCPKIDTTWSGAIPVTLFLNAKSGYRKFFEGQISEKEFEQTLIAAIRSSETKDHAINLLDGPNEGTPVPR